MDNRNKVDVTFGVDFDQALDKSYLARAIIDAFEQHGGFEEVADKYVVTSMLGLKFSDNAVKRHTLDKARSMPVDLRSGLDVFEVNETGDKASAYTFGGTLKSCLENVAGQLQAMDLAVDFAGAFERANEGKYVHPEIKAFYLWMDRKLNGKLQP